ncbi:16S rRNA (guanine(527)-N(7))-methyltransferase RsmG [Desulfoferrobacter suflitae]|uniref:16S rRNA (guanine(527)-N(7))-methyltransferase RsmG n=1 Tax=Desulfoferrobacter suflitae TaxID=2865782 RepID=UPI002164A425|nr:16S rRNA (guanine(527)-N(7))-methyltransferase RsmG [Desulfoferrobacter suflitae]MCK8601515.1 16S rRNA (guanine(527)-N(7))-methyltransferase RsmG [Desulfoferrobacter suflitae]
MQRKNRTSAEPSGSRNASPQHMASLLEGCGVHLTPEQRRQIWTYHQLIREHNPELNLTRIRNFTNMVLKLYADSVIPGRLIELPSPLLDIGTGPGMPGIPLKIVYPHLDVYLAESRRNRIAFLEKVCAALVADHLHVIGQSINRSFEQPMAGVISRAVGRIEDTLDRIHGCLAEDGLAIFMKGPQCDEEIQSAINRFEHGYKLLHNIPYRIPGTPHARRLVVFQRRHAPPGRIKQEAMQRFSTRRIDSEQNEIFRGLKKLLSARGIRKQNQALLSGWKQVTETLRDFPERCVGWISKADNDPPPAGAPDHMVWYQLAPLLFQAIDQFGTHAPLLLITVPPLERWEPPFGFPEGCTVMVPFQDPENVGALIRSAVAFGATQVILLAESAHPYHPKALRASGGAVLRARLLHGPALHEIPADLPIVPLSTHGKNIAQVEFPSAFGLLPGLEGPGIPEGLKAQAVSIPIEAAVESLNAAVAGAIALYVWSSIKADR